MNKVTLSGASDSQEVGLSKREFKRLVEEGYRLRVFAYYGVVGSVVVGYVTAILIVEWIGSDRLAAQATPILKDLGMTEWIDIIFDRRGRRPELWDVRLMFVWIIGCVGATLLPNVFAVAHRLGRKLLPE